MNELEDRLLGMMIAERRKEGHSWEEIISSIAGTYFEADMVISNNDWFFERPDVFPLVEKLWEQQESDNE